MANDSGIVWDETPQLQDADIVWDDTPKTKTVKEVGQSKEQREFARKFIKSQGALPGQGSFLEGVPFIGTPDRAEMYINRAYGPEATAPTVGEAMVKGLGRLVREPGEVAYETAQNVGKSLGHMAALPFKNIRSATPYAQPGDVEAGQELRRLPQTLIKGVTAPTGLYDIATGDLSMPAAREAWQTDPIGSLASMAGAVKAAPKISGVARTAATDLATIPNKAADVVRGVTSGAISPTELWRGSKYSKMASVNYNAMMKRKPAQVQKTFDVTVDKLSPVEERMAYPENVVKNREKVATALDEINDLEQNGVIPPVEETAVSHLQASNAAKQQIFNQEMSPLLQQAGRRVHLEEVGRYWKGLEQKWRAAGQTELADAAARKAASYDVPLTPEGLQDRIAIQNNQLDFGTLAADNPPLANAMRGETRVLNQVLDKHITETVPRLDAGAYAATKSRYGAQITLQNMLVKNILDKLKKDNPAASAGLSRLAAAEGAGGILMANPKLIALGVTTEAINLLRRNMSNIDTLVSRMARTKAALGRQPINRIQPNANMPQAARVPEPFNPETPPPVGPYIGETIPGRVGARGLEEGGIPPAQMTQPRVMNPEVIERAPYGYTGDIAPSSAQMQSTQPRVYDPTIGAEIPIKQSTKPYAKMTVQERKDMVRDLSNKYGLTMKEAADIIREAGKRGKNSGL